MRVAADGFGAAARIVPMAVAVAVPISIPVSVPGSLVVILGQDRADDQSYVHAKYITELVAGTFADETRDGVCRVLDRLRAHEAVDGIILGGTELPLLLRGVDYPVPLLDTTRIHVAAAVIQAAGS